jgi:hypothetical protein
VAISEICGLLQNVRRPLYVLRISDQIVVVFGGEQKTGPKTQDNPALMQVWNESCGMAQALLQELSMTTMSPGDLSLPIMPFQIMHYASTHY